MSRRTTRMARLAALLVVATLVAAACGNSTSGVNSGAAGPGQTDGVKANEIDVGALIAETGPLGGVYDGLVKGVRAYFAMVNAEGGVSGRTLKLTKVRDDATDNSRNVTQAHALVDQDHVFAVFVSSPVFPGGTFLGQEKVPTFGTNFNDEWNSGPSLFGHNGSFNDATRPGPFLPWLAKRVGASSAATIAYTVASSADCGQGEASSFTHFGVNLGLKDVSLQFGAQDVSGDVQQIKEHHVGFVATCMDPTGNTLVYRSLKAAGLNDVKMAWPNGYDQTTLKNFADEMEGVYFGLQHVPFEDLSSSSEMQTYAQWLKAQYPDEQLGEESLYGWEVADLFVTGLRRIGPNVTRKALIDSLNKITNFTGNGLVPPIDWTTQHHATSHYDCSAVVQVQHGKFVPVFASGNSPYVCFAPNTTTLDTIVPPNFSTGVVSGPSAAPAPTAPPTTEAAAGDTAAKAAITAAFVKFLNSSDPDFGGRLAVIQDGQSVQATFTQLSNASAKAHSFGKVTDITLLSTDDCTSAGFSSACASVTYDIYLQANPNTPALPGSKGYAVLDNGTWKVAKQTFCTLASLGGNKCPGT